MVEPPALVSAKASSHSVIPEGVLTGVGAVFSEDIDKAPLDKILESISYFIAKTDVALELFGVVDINRGRGDIKITDPNDFVIGREIFIEIIF